MALNALETACIEDFHFGKPRLSADLPIEEQWLRFGLWTLMETGRMIRGHRIAVALLADSRKEDGSPVTDLEHQIEEFIGNAVQQYLSDVSFTGEETGEDVPDTGICITVDPIDGTWSFLTHTETCSTSLAYFKDGKPVIGMVMNPATGELAYVLEGSVTRLLQMPMFGEEPQASELPTTKDGHPDDCLVNIHPSRDATATLDQLYSQWKKGNIKLVKSVGGSPTWALLEAAKGHYVYVNLWAKSPASSFDLAAGVLLINGAGGRVVDIHGEPINPMGHRGMFIAGISGQNTKVVLDILADNKQNS
jgi:fructose-1,6-bisphosphatase/inositol monophosphatase family enzyme